VNYILWLYLRLHLAGLGLVVITVSSIGNAYYIIVVVWSMFYLFKSFHTPFPWQNQAILSYNESFYANESTSAGQLYFKYVFNDSHILLSAMFFSRFCKIGFVVQHVWYMGCCPEYLLSTYRSQEVLRISQGISHPGGICWDLFGLLLLAWIAVYFCIFRGIKLVGKVTLNI